MENTKSNLLTRREVAAKLRVSPRTLKRWRDSGIVKCIKIGNTIRYKQDEIENLLTSKDSTNG